MRVTRVALRHSVGTSCTWNCGCATTSTDTVATSVAAAAPSSTCRDPSSSQLDLQMQPLDHALSSKHRLRTHLFKSSWKGTGIYRHQHAPTPSSYLNTTWQSSNRALSTSSLSAAADVGESASKPEETRVDPDSQFLQGRECM